MGRINSRSARQPLNLFHQRIDLVMQPHDLQLGAQVDLIVETRRHAVFRRGAILAHHDDRRLHRRQGRQHQVQENERVWIERHPPARQHFRIEQHPAEQHQSEEDDEAPRPANRGDAIGQARAETRRGVVDIGRIAAGRLVRGDRADNAALLGIEVVIGTPEQPQRQIGSVDVGVHPTQRQMPATI